VDMEVAADSVAPSMLPNPDLMARHEAAGGGTTEALGAGIAVDLGLSGISEVGAAQLRARAGVHRQAQGVLEATCTIRRLAVGLAAATRAADVAEGSHERLAGLLHVLSELASGGEVSGYERDRAFLATSAHQLVEAQAAGDLRMARARLTSLVGSAVDSVNLTELAPLPSRDAALARVPRHPELLALQLEVEAGGRTERAARRAVVPDLRIAASARRDAPSGGPSVPGFEVGGALELPRFDWSRQRIRSASADRATLQAEHALRTAELAGGAAGAWERATLLSEAPHAVDPQAVWNGSLARYSSGESSVEDLLQTAEGVEEATQAGVERDRLLRLAHVDLACASAYFGEPTIQSVYEAALP
jgi:hypothetical protein